jgi:hypothetical protein
MFSYGIVAVSTQSPSNVPFDPPEFTAPKNYTDPIKIKDYVQKKTEAWLDGLNANPVLAETVDVSYFFKKDYAGEASPAKFKNVEEAMAKMEELAKGVNAREFTWFSFDVDFTVRLIRHYAARNGLTSLAALSHANRVDCWSLLGVKSDYIPQKAAWDIWFDLASKSDMPSNLSKDLTGKDQGKVCVAMAYHIVRAYGLVCS